MKKFCFAMVSATSVAMLGLYLVPSVEAAPLASTGGEEAVECYQLITLPDCPEYLSNCICAITTTTGDAPGEDGAVDHRARTSARISGRFSREGVCSAVI